ncbi:MAG: LysR family transcriptional regulator [Alphaproteobacteria bacterium]|nr:MAG: LysR family transcriptional regulator [Alphaproteobacteria bacterium]
MNWDDLKIFLAIAEASSMRAAAKQLKVSHTTVSRRIDSLEEDLGVKLFDRRPDGYRLTDAGQELLPLALQTDDSLHAFGRSVAGRDSALEGQVCVTIPDALAVSLFMPLFLSFMDENPGIQIKVHDSLEIFDLSRREADVAIRFTNTPPEHLIGRCLGNMHQAAYATRDYVRVHRPDLEDSTARWIGWGMPEDRPGWIARSPFPHLGMGGHFNNILIQFDATRRGGGIGYFPCFLGDEDSELIRIGAPNPTLDVWLLSHRDLRAAARMRAFRQFILHHGKDIKASLEGDKGETIDPASL